MNDLMHQTAGATPLDPDELAGLRHRHVQTHAELNQLEQVNIQIGQKWLAEQKDPPLLTEHFIREFHRRMLGEVWQWAGQFRQTEKNVGIDPLQIGIEIRNLHDDTSYWIEHMVFEPLEIAARYHHRMLQIHPFPNGNGRHSRLMTNELLKSYRSSGT